MLYFEAPNNVGDKRTPYPAEALFLAGGITNCPDWQSEMVTFLKKYNDRLIVLNPRRKNFPMGNPKSALEQIKWEFNHLSYASSILFWFPKETLCPIVLFELGAALQRIISGDRQRQFLFIGAHPDYERREDVIIQTELAFSRRGLSSPIIYSSIAELEEGLTDYLHLNCESHFIHKQS